MGFFRIVEHGPLDLNLHQTSQLITVYYIVNICLEMTIWPQNIGSSESMIGIYLTLIANIALLFGVLWDNHRLVKLWMIQGCYYAIIWPIVIIWHMFDYWHFEILLYHSLNDINFYGHIVALLIFLYFSRFVYSLHFHMKTVAEKCYPSDV